MARGADIKIISRARLCWPRFITYLSLQELIPLAGQGIERRGRGSARRNGWQTFFGSASELSGGSAASSFATRGDGESAPISVVSGHSGATTHAAAIEILYNEYTRAAFSVARCALLACGSLA